MRHISHEILHRIEIHSDHFGLEPPILSYKVKVEFDTST